MHRAVMLSRQGMSESQGGPFGAVIVKDNKIIAEGCNQVTSTNDPTAHAEVVAIRAACAMLESFQLTDCELYTSCEPCPMCLGAIYWACPKVVYFANSQQNAADIGFDDSFIYEQLGVPYESRTIPFIRVSNDEALAVFEEWQQKADRTEY